VVRSDAHRPPGPICITICSQLVRHARTALHPFFHVNNIDTIRHTVNDLDGLVRDYPEDYPDDEGYETDGADTDFQDDGYGDLAWPADRRWRPVTAIVGAVVALGAIATAVIINSGDSASTKATVGAPVPRPITSAPRTTNPPSASPSTSRAPQLPPETVTTVTTPGAAPALPPIAVPPPTVPPPSATLNPRTVVYSVTGTKQLLDLVTVVYTDARGYPQTEFNVSLPWSKMIVLNPGVGTQSVVATSIYSRINCSIVNAEGQTVVASANNAIMATCTR
jgi:Mycobacterium membrane protein